MKVVVAFRQPLVLSGIVMSRTKSMYGLFVLLIGMLAPRVYRMITALSIGYVFVFIGQLISGARRYHGTAY